MNWSSGAFDPERQIFVTNVNIFAMEVHLIPRDRYQESEKAAKEGRFRAEVSAIQWSALHCRNGRALNSGSDQAHDKARRRNQQK
jgi:glucose dehydrogenase